LTAERFKRNVISQWSFVNGKSQTDNNFLNLTNDQWPMTNDYFYCTGDIARWLPDGNIEFLGRKDHQIQLRGIRVELGEIESILLKQEGISEAAVVACIDNKGEKYLRAAVVSSGELTNDRLRERLAGELPYYMIPTEFLQLEKMPLTTSGKINRKIIAAIEVQESGTAENTSYIAPETQLQMQIVEIWKEVLNQPMVGIHDNFFDLGGNSLGIILVNNKLKEKLQRDIPALVLFEYPTVAALGRYLEREPAQTGDIVDNEETDTVRTGIKSKGRDRMLQRKSKLKEERINQNI
ncbi:MAG: phosphopantetheine-binding protein, partial [Acidobacteria bacterium]|nr:phosphopantetheine-binding protein [Acidobacteriota bacterium]